MSDLTIHSGNATLQLWQATNTETRQYELMVGDGGDWPEQSSIVLTPEQLLQIKHWIKDHEDET